MSGTIEPIATGRFSVLQEYFQNVTLEDLRELETEESLVNIASPAHKVLMRCFSRDVVYSNTRLHSVAAEHDVYGISKQKLTSSGMVNLRYRVVSSALKGLSVADDQLFANEISNYINDMSDQECKRIKGLDLSSNNLLDQDAKYLLDVVEKLNNCDPIEVNVSGNRFPGNIGERFETQFRHALISYTLVDSL